MPDQSDAFVLLAKRARVVDERVRNARVVEPGRLGTDFTSPGGDENLRRLPGARCARMDQNIRKKVAGSQRLGDPPRVRAPALGQLACVIVAPDGGLSLGVTNEKQAAHG